MGLAGDRWPRKFPMSGDNPGGGRDTLWLNMKIWELDAQSLAAREVGGIRTGARVDEMSFLLPMSFAENINHNWEEHQNIMSRAHDAYKTITGHMKEAGSVVTGSGDAISKTKVDTPLVFKGSNRKELAIDFVLADQGNIISDVYEPIRRLREYGAAANKGSAVNIEFPHVFELDSVNGYGGKIPLISIKWAALRSVQPTFHGPYREGYPSKVDLTLTFVDLEALYRESFGSTGFGTKATVSASVARGR